MSALTLSEAAERLDLSPLQVIVYCALRGIPFQGGRLDEDVLPALGTVRPAADDGDYAGANIQTGDETPREQRLRVVRRVLEKLSTMGKFWPARTEKRSAARGLEGSEVGLALSAVDALLDCGILMQEAHGGHEVRVGLDRARRREIAELVSAGVVVDERLGGWIDKG
jgi:hypothetical protein